MWNHLTQYSVKPERRALEVVYRYLQLDMLTNPECNLASNSSLIAGGTVFSRDKGTLPNDFDTFRRKVSSADWDVLMCVAGTESSDNRRVVLLYLRSENMITVNFPTANALNKNEYEILKWLDYEINHL